jgi:hypothetical protein
MTIRQVRTKSNKYNTVKYDSAGNILTPARKRELKELKKLSKKTNEKKAPAMSKCNAITKKKRPCPILVEAWRTSGFCHVHDPAGKFREQTKKKGYKTHTYKLDCSHKWYMRDEGITCKNCLIIWKPEMDANL